MSQPHFYPPNYNQFSNQNQFNNQDFSTSKVGNDGFMQSPDYGAKYTNQQKTIQGQPQYWTPSQNVPLSSAPQSYSPDYDFSNEPP